MPTNTVTTSSPSFEQTKQEGCGEYGPLIGIFLAEFHHIQGPMIRCQEPDEEIVSKELFDSVSVYLIPKPQMARRTITVNALDKKILGFPVILQDKKYKRNQFMFNVCFVCNYWSRTVHFEPALRKMAEYLVNLELEHQYLSSEKNNEELAHIFGKVFDGLNSERKHAEVVVRNYRIQVKVIRQNTEPSAIGDHDVPVMSAAVTDHQADGSDLTTQQILQYIDGFNTVSAIASLASVDTNLVKTCIQNLRHFDAVQIVPAFQYSNCYCATSRLPDLWTDAALMEEYLRTCALSAASPPSPLVAYRFAAAFQHGTTVKDLCLRFGVPFQLKIDPQATVQFLVVRGVIRRVHRFPYWRQPAGQECKVPELLRPLFTGGKSYDEICCRVGGMSQTTLQKFIECEPNVAVISK